MNKRTFNSETEYVYYRAEKQNVLGHWIPATMFGYIIESTSLAYVVSTVKNGKKDINYRTNKPYITGKIRYVKITVKIKAHTTRTKDLVYV